MRRCGRIRYHRTVTTTNRRIPTWAIDALLALTLTVGALVDFSEIDLETVNALGFRTPDAFAVALILLQTVPVAFRRRFPTAALLVASFGFFLGWAVVRALADQGLGSFAIPVSQIVVLVLLAAVAGVIAAIYPSWKASRMNVLAAIAYE
jgi:ABC-type lipoprotein release transport system permease subunit